MKLLREIYDHDCQLKTHCGYEEGAKPKGGDEQVQQDLGSLEHPEVLYKVRKASRAILQRSSGQIAVLYVSKDNYHKLPGGGVEVNEDLQVALARELIEEVGVEAQVHGEIGMIIEYRNAYNLLQISYCYHATVSGDMQEPAFTEDEINDGFALEWMEPRDALNLIKIEKPLSYTGRFIRERDMTFLTAFQNK